MITQLVVRIAHPHVGRIETRVFTQSPVSVGSDPSNVLRLEHSTVSGRQGEIKFTSTSVQYVEYGASMRGKVGGVQVEPATSVRLDPDTLIQIGPYRLCAELPESCGRNQAPSRKQPRSLEDDGSTGLDELGMGAAPMVLSSVGRSAATGDTLTSFVYRALRLADVVSAVVVKLRAGCGLTGQRPFDTSPLHISWNAHEIADYLLDTDASESRLAELEKYLLELAARAQLPLSAGVGRA